MVRSQVLTVTSPLLLPAILLFLSTCTRSPIGGVDCCWIEPEIDGIILSFDVSDDIRVDSTLAGEIQYALEVARSADEELNEIHAKQNWAPGQLKLKPTLELFLSFDTTNLVFNHAGLDSMLQEYPIKRIDYYYDSDEIYWIMLYFKGQYSFNIRSLAEEFKKIDEVVNATPNYLGHELSRNEDITLTIIEDIYVFYFHGASGNKRVVYVRNDTIILHYKQ